MSFEDVKLTDVRVIPQAPNDSFQFQFVLSRVPERFWPEAFTSAYNSRSGLRRIELSADTARITLPEAEADTYIELIGKVVEQANVAYRAEIARQAAEQQRRVAEEQQRQDRARELQRKAKQLLGL